MIDLGSAHFLLDVPSLPAGDFEIYSTRVFDHWQESIDSLLALPDYAISLEIEDGSISGKGKLLAAAGALYIGIGQYSDFVSGLETISGQIDYVSTTLFTNAAREANCAPDRAKTRKNGGAPSKLRSLFSRVQDGRMTVDEAMIRAESILGEDAEAAQGLMNDLHHSLVQTPKAPRQSDFSDDDCTEFPIPEKRKPPRRPRPAPEPGPLSDHHHILIWRDSKNSRRQVRYD